MAVIFLWCPLEAVSNRSEGMPLASIGAAVFRPVADGRHNTDQAVEELA
jgi:hypothetical protein